jgi:hypothetical protein
LKMRRTISKLAAIFLAFYMLMLSGFYQTAWAAMISTESIMHADRSQSPRGYLKNPAAREEIQAALISQGIDPQEARDRIDYLSDDEICKYVDEIDQLHAGGFTVGVIPGFIIIFVLVLVDIFFNSPSAK